MHGALLRRRRYGHAVDLMRLDYLEGCPRVYRTRGQLTFFCKNHRFVVNEGDLGNPDRLIRAVARANKPRPRLGSNAVASFTVISETMSNRLGQLFALLVPAGFVIPLCILLHLAALVGTSLNGPIYGFTETLHVYLIVWTVVLWHELGHAAAAARFGIRTDGIGVGIYLIFPVLMTNVSMVAILPRRERIAIFSAGILFQGYAAIALTALNWFSPSATLEKAIYLNAAIAVLNALPLLRFDGHHIASEYLEIARESGRLAHAETAIRWFNRLSLAGLLSYFAYAVNRTAQSLMADGLTGSNAIPVLIISICAWRMAFPFIARSLASTKAGTGP